MPFFLHDWEYRFETLLVYDRWRKISGRVRGGGSEVAREAGKTAENLERAVAFRARIKIYFLEGFTKIS